MSEIPNPTPGTWLHQAIMGALKGRGIKLESWCKTHGISSSVVRSYTYGLNAGPQSQKLLNKLIDDAGRDAVLSMYKHRLFEEAELFMKAAA